MSDKKIIAVIGATGGQGGGLARAILADPEGDFTPRAVTRNPDSEAARQLAALGAEVVQADLDDEPSMHRAFAGAHGAFCVTNFWEHFSPEREKVQAGNLARAARGPASRTRSGQPWRTCATTCRWATSGSQPWRAATRSLTWTPRPRATRTSGRLAFPPPTCTRRSTGTT